MDTKASKQLPIIAMWLLIVGCLAGLVVNLFELPLLIFVWPISKRVYRVLLTKLLYSFFCLITFLADWWGDLQVTYYGNKEDFEVLGKESALLLGNHRNDLDWCTCWVLADRKDVLGGTKCLVKDFVKYVPTVGWSWWCAEYGFLKRNWEKDKRTIQSTLQALREYPVPFWFGIFVEGTRFTPEKLKASQEFARSKGIEPLKHHLNPRPKGFAVSAHALKDTVPALYDVQCMFEDPSNATYYALLRGETVKAHFLLRRIPMEDVPTGSIEETSKWCRELFKRKDEYVDYFYNNKKFPGEAVRFERKSRNLIVFLFWSFLVSLCIMYGVYYLIFFGSFLVCLTAVSVPVLAILLMKFVLRLLDTSKGSTYGLDSKLTSERQKTE